MTRNLLRAGALSCALMTSTAMCTSPALAQAQGPNLSPPPENFVVSPGGVDMRSGRYAYSQTDLSIGGEEGGLALTRTLAQPVTGHANPFANFSHNWDILVSEKRIGVETNNFQHGSGTGFQIEVTFGGRTETFRADSPLHGFQYVSRSGYATLALAGDRVSSAAVYTLRLSDGTEAVFRPIGSADCSSVLRCAYVSEITQADGTRLAFGYETAGANATRLRSVTSNRGYALVLEHSGGLVTKACTLNLAVAPKPSDNVCPTGALATATYAYNTAGGTTRLASATDASGGVWGFVNAANSQGFVRPGETTAWLTNTIQHRTNDDGLIEDIITSQSFADGMTYAYSWDIPPVASGQVGSIVGGAYVDNANNVTQVRYGFPTRPCNPNFGGDCPPDRPIDENWSGPPLQVTPGPVEVIDPLGRTTITDYCDPVPMAQLPSNWQYRCYVEPRPVSTTSPSGIQTRMTWAGGNLTELRQISTPPPGSPPNTPPALPDIVRSATYDDCAATTFRYCTKPTSITDARAAVSNYTYDPAHGGMLTETAPAPTAGAPRPQTRHEYAQRRAWVSDGSGGYTQVTNPIWVRTASSTCRASAATGDPLAPCATAGDEVRTTHDYGPDAGPNNLQLRGQAVTADGVTLRTCLTYDAAGRRIAQTTPGAGLTQCQ